MKKRYPVISGYLFNPCPESLKIPSLDKGAGPPGPSSCEECPEAPGADEEECG